MAAIRINYTLAIKKAQQLEQLSQDLNFKCCKQVQIVLNDLPLRWRGEAANAYQEKCLALYQKTAKAVEDMKLVSQAIRYAADEIKQADEQLAAMNLPLGN